MRSCLVAGMLCLLALAEGHADEAVLRDGRKLAGRLTLDGTRWQFHPANKSAVLAASELHQVHLDTTPSPPLHADLPLRIGLGNGQWLTGGLIEVDGSGVLLKTAWSARLTVPRAAVRAIRQPPGWALVLADDFEGALKNWKVAGKPARDEHCVVLDRAGQTLEHTLAEGLSEGRVAVSFQESDGPIGAKWLIEADFLVEKQTRRLTVHLAGEGKDYRATAEGLPGESTAVARSTGRHRAVVQFSATSLRVLLDDEALWHSLKKGPDGRLVRWSLTCRALEPERAVQGKIVFSDFSLHRAVDELRHPAGDPKQDEVWLLDGDQLFGRFVRADRQGVVIEGRFGRRVLPWPRIRGVVLKERESVAPLRERVRLWLDNGFDSQPDLIEGVVRSLDDRGCVLRHADLGEITLERSRIRRVAWPGNEQR